MAPSAEMNPAATEEEGRPVGLVLFCAAASPRGGINAQLALTQPRVSDLVGVWG